MASKAFRHAHLGNGKIRLIQAWKDSHAYLRFRFRIVDLEQNHTPYTALSYTWGDQVRRASAFNEDGDVIPLTENCFDLLVTFSSANESRYIWIDALCINQDDLNEKAQQILLMRHIYANAEKVVIWLGKDPGYAEEAFNFVEKLRLYYNGIMSGGGFANQRVLYTSPEYGIKTNGWKSLQMLLSNRWFDRIWVVQEAALATSDPEVICGGQHYPWSTFSQVIGQVSCSKNHPAEVGQQIHHIVITTGFRAQNQEGRRPRMTHALQMTPSFSSADARDKLYGIMGLVRSEDLTSSPAISYDKDLKEICFLWTRHFITNLRQMSALRSAGVGWGVREAGLRSWLHDFTTTTGASGHPNHEEMEACSDEKRLYNACLGLEGHFHITNQKIFQVKGHIVDSVKYRLDVPGKAWGNVPDSILRNAQSKALGFHCWLRTWVQDSDAYKTLSSEERGDVIWRTMMRGMELGADMSKRAEVTRLREIFNEYVKGIEIQSRIGRSYDPTFGLSDEALWFENTLSQSKGGCELFGTYQGYLGLGPPRAESGDKVAVVYGLHSPLLIRELPKFDSLRVRFRLNLTKPYYQLVGECYVHGMMQGEGLGMGSEQIIEMT